MGKSELNKIKRAIYFSYIPLLLVILAAAGFIFSCASFPDGILGSGKMPKPDKSTSASAAKKPAESSSKKTEAPALSNKNSKEIQNIQLKLIEGAGKYEGASNLVVNGRKFNMDCSGAISAIYYYAGIDLQKYYPSYSGTGTERIYKTLKDRKLLKNTSQPEPGDIIFWDNTYDLNKNGQADDFLTHMGMVVSCDNQGTVTYIHYHYQKGIIYEYMNTRYKNYQTMIVKGEEIVINSPMRIKGGSRVEKNWLAGQLINTLGEGYRLD